MVTFQEISPADFFYRNREIAGFTNPSRAVFVSLRELVENSLDSADQLNVPPEVYVRLTEEDGGSATTESGNGVYRLMVMDNGSGISARHIPSAFGQVLFGSNYKLKQARGTFGLGGTMAILYGQITTHKPVLVRSSTGGSKVYEFKMMIDIQRNRPLILDRKTRRNKENWRGTIVEYSLEGDYYRAMSKILEYMKQTALVTPYADIRFVDPKGRLYMFNRATTMMPSPPTETLTHPYGVDVETLQRIIRVTDCRNLLDFMRKHFHRVGQGTSLNFLDFAGFLRTPTPQRLNPEAITRLVETNNKSKKYRKFFGRLSEDKLKVALKKTKSQNMIDFMVATFPNVDRSIILRLLGSSGLIRTKNPKKLKPPEIVTLVRMMKQFTDFLPPDASCLSPLGEDLLRAGILKELKPEFIAVSQRKPSTYAGHPFIVETAIAYGGNIPKKDDIVVYRFANKIPLLYDEASDVSVRVIRSMNWRRYKVASGMPIAILVHLCSTKVPYKTVGKEFIADRPEVKLEILNGIREVARRLQTFLAKREHVAKEKKRLTVFAKYLPKIARFSTDLAGKTETPDIELLLKSVRKYDEQKV
ncbi:MAG: DNA topoisomerase VI subunit B [Candidatus Bathyarchaeum sp.]|nr:MAG: DNA topoisomerase VI subunit B [Candidatus Bathyarchaeum sp.]